MLLYQDLGCASKAYLKTGLGGPPYQVHRMCRGRENCFSSQRKQVTVMGRNAHADDVKPPFGKGRRLTYGGLFKGQGKKG